MAKHKKKSIIVIIVLLLTISVTLYKLADRYLIEHVQVSNALQATQVLNNSNNTSTKTTNSEASSNSSETSGSGTSSENYTADDWNYTSDTKSIKITQVTEGSGQDKITYYVADVVLKDSTDLKSAFAKNQFGTNITENTSDIASDNNAIFAINGDYYGFRDDGITIRNGEVFRDEPARTGLALYEDGNMKIYDETETSAEELISQGVTQTLSFGPALVENSTAIFKGYCLYFSFSSLC